MVKFNFLVAVIGLLLSTVAASPTPSITSTSKPVPSMILRRPTSTTNSTKPGSLAANDVPAYSVSINIDAAQHQADFDELSADGFRMISLSVYGQPPNHLYTSVWVERSGPAYVAIHEATASEYQSFFDANNGFVSTLITVTGPPGGEIFAGVMEKNGVNNWFQLCGLTTAQYEAELSSAAQQGYILKSFTEYGTTAERLYCGIWYHNDQNAPSAAFVDESYADYQTTFNNEVANAGWRPGYLSVSEDHLISSEFVNTNVGSWFAEHGMSFDVLVAQVDTQVENGVFYPIHLQGGGTGDNTNFAGIWAQQDIPI